MELLQFVFSSFWVWLGCVVLIVAAGEAVATAAAGFRQKRKVSVSETLRWIDWQSALSRTSGFPATFSRKNKIATYCPFFLL